MILSNQQIFSDGQAITADAASTNTIDLGATGTPPFDDAALVRDIGKGEPIPILIQVTEAFDNLTNLKISLQVDDNTSFSSATEVASETILLADLVAGKTTNMQCIPKGTNERYMRLYYDVTGTAPTAGKITAAITKGNQNDY